MDTRFGQVTEQLPAQSIQTTGNRQSLKEIPYDYVATFRLEGRRGNRTQDVINVSVDGAFVAVSVGYSFIPALLTLEVNPQSPPTRVTFANLNSGLGIKNTATNVTIDPLTIIPNLFQFLLVKLFGIEFKYTIVDSGVGRELQNKPIHSIAGLGESNGIRPFRPMAKPILFQPRSTIRIEIEEVSDSPLYAGTELYLVLHGYKLLGYGT
jgi:hypothetical protein